MHRLVISDIASYGPMTRIWVLGTVSKIGLVCKAVIMPTAFYSASIALRALHTSSQTESDTKSACCKNYDLILI